MLNLDTHILILAIDGELQPSEQSLLTRNPWSVSAIVLWELAKLVQLGRLDMDLDDREAVRILNRLHVWPIDLDVARASTRLDFRSDPADEIIAATSVVHRVPLITRDRVIRRSKVVPLADIVRD
jgi:PIN domain nuclease of toxin-antitoxin system